MASNSEIARSTVILDGKQAGEALKELRQRAKEVQKELKDLKIQGDSKGYEAKKKELDGIKKSMDAAKKSTYDFDQVVKNLNGSSLKDLIRAQNTLQAEIRTGTRNTKEEIAALREKSEHLRKVKQEIEKVKVEMMGMSSSGKSFFSKMSDGFNKYFGIVTAGLASLAGVVFTLRKTIETFNEYEKAVDNLSALTGLAGEELNWLSQQAKELSTATIEGSVRITQSAQSIVDAYTKVGSKRPELLKNKEALNEVTKEAIILAEAANSDLAPAIDALTMVLNQFNFPAQESRRIINALAAGSKEGAGEIPYLTTAIEKSGTIAADAGISIEQLIGTIETLAPRITQPEIAGRQLKGVLLDLQKGADDFNPAVVGLETALDNLASANLNTGELIKMFGEESITAAKILINNREELKKYTAAVTETNVAIEQATTNTDNNASKLDQARNRFQLVSMTLGEKVAPAFTFSTNSASYFIKALLALIQSFHTWAPVLAGSIAAITAYTLVVKRAIIWKKIYEAILWRVMLAQEALNKSMKANPWGLVLAGIAAVITWLATYSKKTKEAEAATNSLAKAQKTYTEKLAEEQAILDLYINRLKKTNNGSNERKNLIDEINNRYGTTIKNLKDETEFLKQINTNYIKIIQSIKAKAMLEAKSEQLVELYKKRQELINLQQMLNEFNDGLAQSNSKFINPADASKGYAEPTQSESDRASRIMQYEKELNAINAQIEAVSNLSVEEQALITTTNDLSTKSTKNKEKEKDAYEKLTAAISEQEALLRAKIASGDPNTQATIARIEALKNEKATIDAVYDAYMNVLSLPVKQDIDDFIKWADDMEKRQLEEFDLQTKREINLIISKMKADTDKAKKQAEDEKKKQEEEEKKIALKKESIRRSFEAGAAAVDEAENVEEAGKAILNSIRQQIKAVIAEAIAKSVADALVSVPFPFNIAIATAAGAAATMLFNEIVPQFSSGRYEVTGAQDGKRYQAEWSGLPVTGLYTRPALVAETGSEIIIDPFRTRNIMMNYPYLLEAIKSVPQHASGTVPQGPGQVMAPPELMAVLSVLSEQLQKGIRGKIVYSDFEDVNDRVNSIRNSVKTS